ncbi:hypothetical protein [Mesorhizobium sp. INR15]|uniref:hypothetical protein n=1 Tax=Mesorhizobium sp. INR15 TaxID=2654248 RepID=UPI00189660EC|nr:hypothetical protein [Mesorhizobium sp. INR15]QPC89920.1 hypothetical protein GA829_04560 [Mesorhizobium sp. INR15]
MTLTFTVDPTDEHQATLCGAGNLPDGLPNSEPAAVLGDAGATTAMPSRPWRLAAALFSQLLGKRRRLPPQDDHLRRDIGLQEQEPRREYWDYYWWDH